MLKADNKYIPLDTSLVTKRRREEDASFLPEKKDRWKKFKIICTQKFAGPIATVDCSKRSDGNADLGFTLAIGGSTRIDLHNFSPLLGDENKQKRELLSSKMYTRFKNFVRCLSIREDGKLIAACDDSGVVQLFDVQNRSQLRKMDGHSGSARCCVFSKNNPGFLLTAGDDTALKLWDISDGSCRACIPDAHSDSISCVVADPVLHRPMNTLIFASGSYDGYVKLWRFPLNDENIPDTTLQPECFIKFLHGDPLTSLAFFSEGALLVSTGGLNVKIWDVTGGGKMIHSFQSHVKTVTAVSIAQDGSYIVTGSLDQTIKFHCSSRFTVLHSISVDDAVTSLKTWMGMSGEELLAVGLSDGQWMLRQRVSTNFGTIRNNNFQEMLKIKSMNQKQRRFFRRGLEVEPQDGDFIIEETLSKRFSSLDKLVQGFNFQLSLDYAVKQQDGSGLALIDTLIDKGALHIAVQRKNETTILPLLAFVHREFGKEPTYTPILLEFMHCILVENPWLNTTTDHLVTQALQRISSKLEIDISEHQILRELCGLTELVNCCSMSNNNTIKYCH